MQTAIVTAGTLIIPNGGNDSNVIPLSSYADAEVLYIGSNSTAVAATVEVALDAALTIFVPVIEFGSPVATQPLSMLRVEAPGGYGLRLSASAVVGAQTYTLWKRGIIG